MNVKHILEQAFQELEQELKSEESRAKQEIANEGTRILGRIRLELVRDRRLMLDLIKSRFIG